MADQDVDQRIGERVVLFVTRAIDAARALVLLAVSSHVRIHFRGQSRDAARAPMSATSSVM